MFKLDAVEALRPGLVDGNLAYFHHLLGATQPFETGQFVDKRLLSRLQTP